MLVRPLFAALGGECAIVDPFAQARPVCLPRIERRQGVTILHRGGHDADGQPIAVGIHQRHTFAPEHLLACIVTTGSAHRDAFHRLGVDDAQPGGWATPRSPAAGDLLHVRVEQALLAPAAEPAIDGAPRRERARQRTPAPPFRRCQAIPATTCV